MHIVVCILFYSKCCLLLSNRLTSPPLLLLLKLHVHLAAAAAAIARHRVPDDAMNLFFAIYCKGVFVTVPVFLVSV